MTPRPDAAAEEAAAREWHAGVRLSHELGRIGFGWHPSLRSRLLASSGQWAIIIADARWGRRS